jgi:hypothetical protein
VARVRLVPVHWPEQDPGIEDNGLAAVVDLEHEVTVVDGTRQDLSPRANCAPFAMG